MVQGFPQDYRIYQGSSCVVIAVQLMQVLSGEGEGGYVPVVERNTGQVAAVAQKECSLEYIGGFVVGHFFCIHLLCLLPVVVFRAEMR